MKFGLIRVRQHNGLDNCCVIAPIRSSVMTTGDLEILVGIEEEIS